MRWKAEPEPKVGDTRVITAFAILPTKVDDGTTVVWLETFHIHQTRVSGHDRNFWLDGAYESKKES